MAYEPVWAIGTGKTPTTPEVASAHAHIRKVLGGLVPDAAGVRLLYGGSVKGSNAAELLSAGDVDGALVGGASLKAEDFFIYRQGRLKTLEARRRRYGRKWTA